MRVFNSITDNPSWGDERNFVRIREAGSDSKYSDEVNLEVGKRYEICIYFHNNAKEELNQGGKGIADNVRLSIAMPEKLDKGQTGVIQGSISSTNTAISEVWDKTYMHANDTVYLSYVGNSATLHSEGDANGSVLDAPSLFGQGAKIGYFKKGWGIVPAGIQYAGYVTVQFQVDKPGFYITSTVSKEMANNYDDTITVSPGEILDFRIDYENTGTTDQSRVTVYDKLPEGMEYIKGSTILSTPVALDGVVTEDKLFDGGLGIGDFRGGEKATIKYKVRVLKAQSELVYNNVSVATANGTMYDKVKITVADHGKNNMESSQSNTSDEFTVKIKKEWLYAGIGIAAGFLVCFIFFRRKK